MIKKSGFEIMDKIISQMYISDKEKQILEKISFLNSKNSSEHKKNIANKEANYGKICWKGTLEFFKLISAWKISNNCPFKIKGVKSRKFFVNHKKKLKNFITRKY